MFFPDFKQAGQDEVLSMVAAVAFIVLVVNYLANYLPVSLYKRKDSEEIESTLPLSVIICAKNEDEHLTEFLPKIMKQDYPNFEVIVVNDCSWDNTENVIDEYAAVFPNLRKANIKEDPYYKHGKKFAMLVGIKAAKNNHLVFTDADCYPASNSWLKEMAKGFSEEKKIVLGYGAYEKQKGLLNRLIRFDSFMIAVQYLSAAIKNKPYMGVGRNLAYTKELFFEEKGFSHHYHINSGDDDLFVNAAATEKNTSVCVSKDAVTYSIPSKTFRDWNIQKSRHLTTAPMYTVKSKARIAFNYFSQYYFYLSLIGLCFSYKTLLLIPIALFLKGLVQVLILNGVTKRLNERDLLFSSIFCELILLIFYPIFQVSKLFYKPNKWTN